jgi:hypothetical protein
MKKGTFTVLFLITLLAGLNIAVPTAVAMGKPSDPGGNEAMTQDQNAANSAVAAFRRLGTIQIGPSASGEAVRILSTAYTLRPLRPLRGKVCRTCLGIVVGPADLSTPSIIDQVRAAYGEGHGIALTNATQASIKQLHDLLGHRGSAQPPSGVASADLVAFRKAFRADGQLHSSSHVLLPRADAAGTAGLFTRKDKKSQQRTADANDIKALERIFSAIPVVPGAPPGDDQQNLLSLAESYESHAIQSDSFGNQAQLTNSVWAARSFQNSADFYYVLQEADYALAAELLNSWSNEADTSLPYQNVTLLQPSPQTTREATQVTSGVSTSVGVSVGFNTAQGLNASVTRTTTISNSKSTTVPAMSITNNANFSDASTEWLYDVNDLSTGGAIDLFNQWIWQVPFSSYSASDPPELVINNSSHLNANVRDNIYPTPPDSPVNVEVQLTSSVPWPFGRTFAIQQPAVTGVSPSCVDSGDQFTIQGTGLYPSLVEAVLIGGTSVDSANITTVSDQQINVIAPDTIECHGTGCPVAVQTTQGTSNTNFNIVISDFCGD